MDPRLSPRPGAACPRCGASFACGVDDRECWCARLPPLAAAPAGAGAACLCPACLGELTRPAPAGNAPRDGSPR